MQLAKHNPSKIYIACRNQSKGQAAAISIRELLGESTVEIQCLPLDLASFQSIRSTVKMVEDSTDRLDILICNAGIFEPQSTTTESGFEIHMGTNHIGHHLLTKLLLPILERTAALADSDVRVVTVSSLASGRAPPLSTILDPVKLAALDMGARYGASKAANIYFAAELARRHPAITSVSVHPGTIDTDIWNPARQNSIMFRILLAIVAPLMFISLQAGAHTQLWAAAVARKDELENGAYYIPVGKLQAKNEGNQRVKDLETCKAVWDWTEAEIAKVNI